MRRAILLSAVALAALAVSVVGSVGGGDDATAAPPTQVTTGQATDVTQQTAKLAGTLNPAGSATTYTFEYGPTASYGAQTKPTNAGSGNTSVPANANLNGLAPNTIYHYRLVATNAQGETAAGADRTFTTPSRTSRLRLFGHTAFVGPGRQVGVFTSCQGDRNCRGSLRMTSGGTTIGTRSSYFIRANSGGIVHVPLNSAGRRRVNRLRRGSIRTQVSVSSADAGSDSASVDVVRYFR
jgi:hypothetical protein